MFSTRTVTLYSPGTDAVKVIVYVPSYRLTTWHSDAFEPKHALSKVGPSPEKSSKRSKLWWVNFGQSQQDDAPDNTRPD